MYDMWSRENIDTIIVVVPRYRELHVKKVLRNSRTSSNAIARMVFRKKLERDSGKKIDRSGGGMAARRLFV
eukprot:scaffold20353_cov76-Skeletonema_dohrnii-CCMP3373.AAC.2